MVIVAKNGIKQHFKPIFGKESDLRTKQQFRSYAHLIAIDKRPATLQINQLALGLCPLVANRAGSHAQKRELAPLQEPVGELRADWKSHATLTPLAKQDCPLWLQYD